MFRLREKVGKEVGIDKSKSKAHIKRKVMRNDLKSKRIQRTKG